MLVEVFANSSAEPGMFSERTSTEIAQIIHISPKNVETYRGNLMKKLELHNPTELVKFAIRYGLTPLE